MDLPLGSGKSLGASNGSKTHMSKNLPDGLVFVAITQTSLRLLLEVPLTMETGLSLIRLIPEALFLTASERPLGKKYASISLQSLNTSSTT